MAVQGQCKLSVIPVRSEPKSQAEIVTQILFGETYIVLSKTPEWLKVKMDFDGYEGWISENQFSSDIVESDDLVSRPFVLDRNTVLPMGSEISGKNESTEVPKANVIKIAKSLLNSPYLWGGRTFMGIDCSGFVQVIHKVIGVSLPRDASQQVTIGEEVLFGNQKAGDLVFFVNEKQRVNHVGMMINQREIIHASGGVRIDDLTVKGIVHSEIQNLTHSLFQIKRIR